MKHILHQMAEALLARKALELRELVLEWYGITDADHSWEKPSTGDERVVIAAAAIAELLASRTQMTPPQWAMDAGRMAEPFYASASAESLDSIRRECEEEGPEELRKHGILAPSGFLTFA